MYHMIDSKKKRSRIIRPSYLSITVIKSFRDRQKSDIPFLERDMTVEECTTMCTSHQIPLREKLFFRMIYETLLQPSEVLNLRIENWDRRRAFVTAVIVNARTKPLKRNMSKKVWLSTKPKIRVITQDTNDMLRKYVRDRKKGPIFINSQTGGMISLTWFNKEINRYAKLLGIQKIKKYFKDSKAHREKPRNLKLVTLMALKKAGKSNCI